MDTPLIMVFLGMSLVIFSAGIIGPALAWQRPRLANGIGAAAAMAGAALGLTAAFGLLAGGATIDYSLSKQVFDGNIAIRLDGLAAFFLVPVFLLLLVTAGYAAGYLRRSEAPHWIAFNLLAASMVLVIIAANSLLFLVGWELMSLSSFLLVIHELDNEQSRRAGWTYLVATHLGTAFLFLFFLEAYRLSGSLDFAGLAVFADLPVVGIILFFCLALVGFGTKAGLFPLHVWLPDAHAAAPSHVSALMSGVMIKTAVYAFLRIVSLQPHLPPWCGALVAVLGGAGALFGIAMASVQADLKRSLAYSTVENIGIIFLALGVWLSCRGSGDRQQTAAVLVLAGGLLHIWNHALFKALLFMAAGSVLHATGTRQISAMGGLLRRMPQTAMLLTVGGAAIAALPPFNGLIGELFIYLGLLYAGQAVSGGMAFYFMVLVLVLALAGGLTLLVVTRIIGVAFSGEPRSSSTNAHESPVPMILAMAVPAGLCLGIGLFPNSVLAFAAAPLRVLAPGQLDQFAQVVAALPFGPAWSVAGIALVGIAGILVARRCPGRPAGVLTTWGCGFNQPGARMAYTAGGFSQVAQDGIYCSCLRTTGGETGRLSLFPAAFRVVSQSLDPLLGRVFVPFFGRVIAFGNACRRLQSGQLGIYMSYFFLAIILLLGWTLITGPG